ncbi:MAG TPA: hypothetical protein VIH90_05625 [Candidatus Saccharimonadales bacterium]
MPIDIYHPAIWIGFFQLVGTAAAALTGLVFVSMSLNLHVITQDATHRYRAIGTLAGLTAIFMICAFAIMGGQNHLAVGVEWLIISVIALSVYIHGYIQAYKGPSSKLGLGFIRLAIGTICHLIAIAGAITLISGHIVGIYISAIAMILYIPFLISGAWLLMIGVHQDLNKHKKTN